MRRNPRPEFIKAELIELAKKAIRSGNLSPEQIAEILALPSSDINELIQEASSNKVSPMRIIPTEGISYLEPLIGSGWWTWGTDYTAGDLYEAERLYLNGRQIRHNRLIFVHCLEACVVEPIRAKEGQFFGRPAFDDGATFILLADFIAKELRLLRYNNDQDILTPIVTLPRYAVEDCNNLMVYAPPLMLARQSCNRFQIIWPEKADFPIQPEETFVFREGDFLYFSRWYEDPDYREEVVIRNFPSGEIVDQFRGSLNEMPDGQHWLLTE